MLTEDILIGHVNAEKISHAVASNKQSPVLTGKFFLALSWKISYEMNLF